MRKIRLTDIIIPPNRQRQDFEPEALMELTTSINDIGLLHAPVVRETPEGYVLVAGERRIRAIQDSWMINGGIEYNGELIPEGFIPITTLGELSHFEAEEAELDENLKRRDLTWQELASAHERLHKLRVAQAAEVGITHAIADTAMELTGRRDGAYQDGVRRELIVAKHLDNAEVAKAKTVDDAFKILKRQEATKQNIALAERVGKTFDHSIHELHNVNCLEWMRIYIDGIEGDGFESKIDVICTDPPYGMNAQNFGDGAGKLANIEHHYDDSYESWQKLMRTWCNLSFRVVKPQAHAYVWCDFDRFHELKMMMQEAGWYVFRTPLINVKPNSGRVPLPDSGPRRQYEICLYAIKGKKPVTHIYSDVITTQSDEQMSHGAQKPVELYKNILQRSVRAGDVVLDCFAGTGPIFPAAHHFKCKAIGLEMSKEYYATCTKRIGDLV